MSQKRNSLLATLFVAVIPSFAAAPFLASEAQVSPRFGKQEVGIVLLHGRLGTAGYLYPLAQALRDEGYRVETPAMSWSRDRKFDTTVEESMAEIDVVANRLKAQGARQLIIGGHSLGGAAALRYGAARENIGGIILIAAGWNPGSARWQDIVGESVRRARNMIAAGQGSEAESFQYVTNDGKSGTVNAHAKGFFDFNRPDSPIALADSARAFKRPVPVLWLSASGDSRSHNRVSETAFNSLPSHPHSEYAAVNASHREAVKAVISPVSAWLDRVRR